MEFNTAAFPVEFSNIIKEIAKSQDKGHRAIAKALIMCCWASIVQKSPIPANELVKALRKSTKKIGVVTFLEFHGHLVWQGEKKGFVYFKAPNQGDWSEVKDEIIKMAGKWEDYRPAPTEKDNTIDVLIKIDKLIDSVQKAKDRGAQVEHVELLALVQRAVSEYTGALYTGELRRVA